MKKINKLSLALLLLVMTSIISFGKESKDGDKPNILVLFLDDLDPDFGCYGNRFVTTPAIDKLASEGVRFTNAFATAPVCSPSHTSLFTGCYSSTVGCPQHRSSYIERLPDGYHILTQLMSKGGYFTVNFKSDGDRMYNKIFGATAKTDLNFDRGKPENNKESGKEVFDYLQIIDPTDISTYFKGGEWEKKHKNQPFFAYANIETGKKHGFEPGRTWAVESGIEVDSTLIEIPPHYSDTPEVRHILSSALDAVSHADVEVGKFLTALDQAGLKENTLVILLSDHGATLSRHKQCLWYTGLHIPMIIRWPGKVNPAETNQELASIIDIAPTVLSAAHISTPKTMEGLNLLEADLSKRKQIFATRDGMDGFFDCSRAVISRDYYYIHHFFPELPFRGNHYSQRVLTFPSMLELYNKGELDPLQSIYFEDSKVIDELYYFGVGEEQTDNLALNPNYSKQVTAYRKLLFKWQKKSGDEVIDARRILKVDKVPVKTKVDALIK